MQTQSYTFILSFLFFPHPFLSWRGRRKRKDDNIVVQNVIHFEDSLISVNKGGELSQPQATFGTNITQLENLKYISIHIEYLSISSQGSEKSKFSLVSLISVSLKLFSILMITNSYLKCTLALKQLISQDFLELC